MLACILLDIEISQLKPFYLATKQVDEKSVDFPKYLL